MTVAAPRVRDGGPWVWPSSSGPAKADLLVNRMYFNRLYVVYECVRRTRGDKPGWLWCLSVKTGTNTCIEASGIHRSGPAAKRELARWRAQILQCEPPRWAAAR